MIRVGICDDIPFYVEALAAIVENWAHRSHIHVQVERFFSGEEVLWSAEQEGEFTAVFLDVELAGRDGVKTAVGLREKDRYVNIIFVSQYDSYFRQMLEVRPCYFLEKPIDRSNVFEILDRIADERRWFYARFQFCYKRTIYSVFLCRVVYFTSERRRIRIVMENGKEYVFYGKLDDLERQIAGYEIKFIRIHKSFLVNGRQVEQYHYEYLQMSNDEKLPVSSGCREKVSRYHMKLLQEM